MHSAVYDTVPDSLLGRGAIRNVFKAIFKEPRVREPAASGRWFLMIHVTQSQ